MAAAVKATPFNPFTDLVDLKGKVAIVTGGNTGIGLATVRHLARAGAKVYLAARNEARVKEALAKLESEGFKSKSLSESGTESSNGSEKGEVVWLKLDLSDPRDAKKAALEFLEKEKRLDILINNAAIMDAPHVVGSDGVANMVTVNYISPLVFTRTLLPLLKETAKEPNSDVRIVNVASIVHRFLPTLVKFDVVEDFNETYSGRPFSGLLRYGHSKLLMIMWTRTLQRHLKSEGSSVLAIAIHPGGVDTFTHKWPFPALWKVIVGLAIASPERGSYTSVFAAASKEVAENKALYEGAYLESKPVGRIAVPHKVVLDEVQGEKLWKTSEDFLEKLGI